ncbi:acetolactate synthase large subunit [soil metagenome]
MDAMSNGAQAMLAAARQSGATLCFANPGTTEMPLVQALDDAPGVRAVLGLFEGVCTGAADGYGRMLGRPALTLLHLGPGLANGIANLHNAKRARSPVVNLIGQHTAEHLRLDTPLDSDIAALAATVSSWTRTVASPEAMAADMREAISHAGQATGHVATLIVPVDHQSAAVAPAIADAPPPASAIRARPSVAHEAVEGVAGLLRDDQPLVFLLGSDALSARGQRAAARIASATRARFYGETFPARVERGGGLPDIDRLPYFPEPAIAALGQGSHVVLAGSAQPVSLFGYAGLPGTLSQPARTLTLSAPGFDSAAALEALAEAVGAGTDAPGVATSLYPIDDAPLTPTWIGRIVSNLLPEDSIVSVEGSTCGYPFFTASARARRHTVMTNTGGSIGQGLPCALGASLACPGQRVLVLQSDGSALFTIQALWTMAREQLPITVLIASNRRYAILQSELARMGISKLGPQAERLTEFNDPPLDWVAMSRGYAVPAVRVQDTRELERALGQALHSPGPMLIEMVL